MKVLITGGNGFIGKNLTNELLKKNYKVRVFDNKRENKLPKQVEFIQGDLRNKEKVNKATKDIDYVFYKAAVAINRSLEFPEESLDINLKGSFNVFESCLKNKVKKVIFSSSASVYGKGQNIDAFYTSVVDNFIKKVLEGESPEIHGKGNQSMDLINVRDVVKADIMTMESKVNNEIFNVGSGKQTTVKELAELILKILDKKSEVKYIDREVIASRRQADISKIRKMLGWEPEVKLEGGIREIVEGYRNERI